MPAKTGGSHASAAFVSMLIGTTMSKYIWELVPPIGEATLLLLGVIEAIPGLSVPVTEEFGGALLVILTLSFAWGVVYHVSRHG
ncbi:hypothetical protein [Salinibaculum salinum]|uniref:hypothetical protein n=1 Tax=Salinibaculum salinum TaxID=3131996 RepID=UPI0030EF8776